MRLPENPAAGPLPPSFAGVLERVADARWREGVTVSQLAARERILPLPAIPYPATMEVERTVSAACLVSYEGNGSSVPPGLHGQRVRVRRRPGSEQVELGSAADVVVARHRLAPAGAGPCGGAGSTRSRSRGRGQFGVIAFTHRREQHHWAPAVGHRARLPGLERQTAL